MALPRTYDPDCRLHHAGDEASFCPPDPRPWTFCAYVAAVLGGGEASGSRGALLTIGSLPAAAQYAGAGVQLHAPGLLAVLDPALPSVVRTPRRAERT